MNRKLKNQKGHPIIISKIKNRGGLSLIEILIVITIFAVLGIITVRSVFLTLQGSKKTEAIVRVRESLNYTMGVIERQIRNANSISPCPLSNVYTLNYNDSEGKSSSFSCVNIGGSDGYIASGSARLTNDSINVSSCQFTCTPGASLSPSSISIDVSAVDKTVFGVSGTVVSVSNKILLRNY